MNQQSALQDRVENAAHALQDRFGDAPATALVLGSGLGAILDNAEIVDRCGYAALGLPVTSTFSHAGELVLARLGGRPIAVLSGRVHYYEGHPMEDVVAAVRAVARWGAKRVLMTNAVGGLVPEWEPGEVVLVRDHINHMGLNPLRGPNPDGLGERFPDMSAAYDPALRADALAAAADLGVTLQEGELIAVSGPSFETPAEIRMFQILGAHVVGMSTVPEIIALTHMGTPAIAFSVVTNKAAGIADGPVDHLDVVEVTRRASEPLSRLITELLSRWDD